MIISTNNCSSIVVRELLSTNQFVFLANKDENTGRRINYYINNITVKICLCFLLVLMSFAICTIKTKAEGLVRSTSLHEIITLTDNIERRDYYNDEGEITLAANKHYATVIITKGDNTLIEEYFDEKGNPVKQSLGNYALLRSFNDNGQEYKITYLDIHGQPSTNRYGYAIAYREFDENGVRKEKFFDENENPVRTKSLGCAVTYEYDDSGRIIVLCYLDSDGKKIVTDRGYAEIHRVYYESGPYTGKVKYEYYYDDKLQPISLIHGQFGLYQQYDDLGRCNLLTFLDADGSLLITNEGYAIVKRTYYDDDSIQTEFYYDSEGKPVFLSEGQYGIKKIGNKTIYLDAEGNEMWNLRNFLHSNPQGVFLFCFLAVFISMISNKKMNMFFVAINCCMILYMTIMHRESWRTTYNFDAFWSYKQMFSNPEIALEILYNILLFVPFGTMLKKIYPKRIVLLVPIVFSFAIEAVQLITGTGLCELDDIISNGLGAVIGFYIGKLTSNIVIRIKK